MPKSVPIISDWSEAERLALVKEWHPNSEVTRLASADGDDQEAWYSVVSPVGLLPGESRTSYHGQGKNHYRYKLTVKHCQQHLGPR